MSAPAPPVASAAPAARSGRRGPSAAAAVGGGALALAVIALLHLSHGRGGVGPADLPALIAGDEHVRAVLLGGRLPRTLAGVVAGAAFAVSGALLQSAVRNPLAAPDTLGVTAGGYLAMVAATVTGLSFGDLPRGAIAFLGGLAAAAVVHAVAGGRNGSSHLVLAGVSVSLALSSVSALLVMLFEAETGAVFFWGHGSLAVADTGRSLSALPLLAAGLAGGLLLARALDILGTGDDTARGLGVPVGRVRAGAVLLSVLLAAGAVAVTGPIGFIGLAAPHIVRLCGVRRHLLLLPAAALWGASLLLAADLLARVTSPTGNEVPAGVVAALFGAPLFLVLARRLPVEPAAPGTAAPTRRGRRIPAVPVVAGGTVLLGVLLAAGLLAGDVVVPPGELVALATGDGGDLARTVVAEYRLPRLLVAALAGAMLAVAGGIVQTVARNPMADLTVMGVSGGAGFGAALVLVALPMVPYAVLPVAAFAGAAAAFATAYGLSRRGGSVAPERLVLVGIGMFALTTAATNYLVTGAQFRTAQALRWLSGSTYARDTTDLLVLGATTALAAVPLAVALRRIDLLALGEDTPRTLGLPLERTRLWVLALAVALAASAVAVVGTVAFVGLVAPHAARMLTGSRAHRLLPVAGLFGAALMVVADTVGRTVIAPAEIPSGLLAAVIGTPYFAWRLRRDRKG
ncbi:iron ABC transporter permease [Nocardiopsis sp. RSe5-2]|uniref:Iron ABC transporter permease n=1 Tax=Nocardiopsis endophytica TaxID=3018445 RepID=A0ABT4U300_9ACTN|nr:iron ABC transporter permease [Nocardiopsis endophytica]MDA2811331.1 iron ABC transporter permease [Nocardiopsis endophytica]